MIPSLGAGGLHFCLPSPHIHLLQTVDQYIQIGYSELVPEAGFLPAFDINAMILRIKPSILRKLHVKKESTQIKPNNPNPACHNAIPSNIPIDAILLSSPTVVHVINQHVCCSKPQRIEYKRQENEKEHQRSPETGGLQSLALHCICILYHVYTLYITTPHTQYYSVYNKQFHPMHTTLPSAYDVGLRTRGAAASAPLPSAILFVSKLLASSLELHFPTPPATIRARGNMLV